MRSLFAKATLALSLALGLLADAYALERTVVANVRDEDGDIVSRAVVIKDLVRDDRFEGRYFKIVLGQGSEAIRFDADPLLTLRAATAYHHLTIARDWFARQTDLKQPNLNDQIVVRVEMDRQFSQFIHFKNADKNPDFSAYNFCATMPAANDYTVEEDEDGNPIEPWGIEIWFMQAKPVDRESKFVKAAKILNSHQFKWPILRSFLIGDAMTALNRYFYNGTFDDIDAKYTLYSMALSVGLVELTPWLLEWTAKLFSPKYSLDTGLIPELMYHEYAHVVLAHQVDLFEPTPVVEGYPNYFAAKISGLRYLGANAGDYNTDSDTPRDGESKSLYTFETDHRASSAHGSYVMSLLLDLDRAFTAAGADGFALVKHSTRFLNARSDVKRDLSSAIVRSINAFAKTRHQRRALLTAFNAVIQKRGL